MEALGKLLVALFIASRLVEGGGGQGTENVFVSYVAGSNDPSDIKVAVLPFRNLTENTLADRQVIGCFVTYLLASGEFSVVDPSVVEKVLREVRVRNSGLDAETVRRVSERLQCPLLLVGTITEFGTPRFSPTPAVSVALNVRLLYAPTAQIVWAASVSRTERVREPLLGRPKAPTLMGLAHQVIRRLVTTMVKEKNHIAEFLGSLKALPLSPRPEGKQAPPKGPSPSGTTPPIPPKAKEGSPEGLQRLLKDISGFEKEAVTYAEHFYAAVTTAYRNEKGRVEVVLIDYREASLAKAFVESASEGREGVNQVTIDGASGFAFPGRFGTFHLNLAVGRFGLFLRTFTDNAELAKHIATQLVKGLP